MPELPEVETVARDLRGLVIGCTITGVRCDWPRTIRTGDVEGFTAGVLGHCIVGVGRRAKLLLIELEGSLVVGIHLKMTGQLFVVPASAGADRHVHLAFELDDGRELRFRDMRKFGRVGLYPRDAVPAPDEAARGARGRGSGEPDGAGSGRGVHRELDLGPEPLDPGFSLARFRALIRGRRGRLKSLLMDQAFLAGIGNIYADEALWRARLHPLRSAASLRPDDERRLHAAIREVLGEAVAHRGSSIDDYTAPEGDGGMQERLAVYQRAGEACPRCGRPVHRVVLGQRSTHFCSWCQRLPAADRQAAAAVLRTERIAKRRGTRWTELAGVGTVGLTPREAAVADRRARTERTRLAAATRRAAARGGPATRDATAADATARDAADARRTGPGA